MNWDYSSSSVHMPLPQGAFQPSSSPLSTSSNSNSPPSISISSLSRLPSALPTPTYPPMPFHIPPTLASPYYEFHMREVKEEPSSAQESGGGKWQSKPRRYKTPSPQLLRCRRNAANERERRRMNTLNRAYDKLRTVLPDFDSGRRLSKFETLHTAQRYIECLMQILNSDTIKDNN